MAIVFEASPQEEYAIIINIIMEIMIDILAKIYRPASIINNLRRLFRGRNFFLVYHFLKSYDQRMACQCSLGTLRRHQVLVWTACLPPVPAFLLLPHLPFISRLSLFFLLWSGSACELLNVSSAAFLPPFISSKLYLSCHSMSWGFNSQLTESQLMW